MAFFCAPALTYAHVRGAPVLEKRHFRGALANFRLDSQQTAFFVPMVNLML